MSVQREIWQEHIVEALYAANPHLILCTNADQYVLAGKVVHIPQAGASPSVKRNRTVLPAAVTRRQDVDVTYAIDEFTSDPIHIPDADTAELSYDKRNSVLTDTNNALGESVGVAMLYNWAPTASRFIRTSGVPIAAHIGKGQRLKIAIADLKKAQKQLNKDGIPTTDRYAMMDAELYDQFTDGLTETQHRDFSRAYDEKNGVLGKLFGFTILSRSYVLSYKGLSANLPENELHDASCGAVLCWHISAVERALGEVKFFDDEGNPQYYGDIYSALVRMGGRKRREDQKGVVAIVQGFDAPAWATGTKYTEGAFVTHEDVTYYCKAAHTASADLATDADKWEGVE